MISRAATKSTRRRKHRKASSERDARLPAPTKSYCGQCTGHHEVWCPSCCGFAGCRTCRHTRKVPCPVCADGELGPIRW